MQLKYTPLQLEVREKLEKEGDEPLLQDRFEGFLEIRCPSYPERLRLPKELGIENLAPEDESKDADHREKMERVFKNLELMALCADKIKTYITAVDLKDKTAGVELKTVDDLYDYPHASAIVAGLCSKFITGFVEKKA